MLAVLNDMISDQRIPALVRVRTSSQFIPLVDKFAISSQLTRASDITFKSSQFALATAIKISPVFLYTVSDWLAPTAVLIASISSQFIELVLVLIAETSNPIAATFAAIAPACEGVRT